LGIECLLAEDAATARTLAARLDQLNRERREIEDQMRLDAQAILAEMPTNPDGAARAGCCLFDPGWHQGVIGILASRIKDRLHRPVIAFAPSGEGEIKGSARSIPGVHIRDVLSDIAVAHPDLLSRFGGHAMAAGLSLRREQFPRFAQVFEATVARHLDGLDLDQVIHSDGELGQRELRIDMAEMLQQGGPWGQNFPEPLFDGEFEVQQCRIVGERHLKWVLQAPGQGPIVDAICFFVDEPERWLGCRRLRLAYRLDVNEFRDNRSLQLRIEYMESL
ncbi:MAG: single-stranded-DNA-specific exonuclease RecJ, partial [Methylococcaceae bacterium]|nr:single-stranded-DNA-specific exonuclease RecJ [Methylococcaceae bacterium]